MGTDQRVAIIVRFGLNPQHWAERHARGDVVDETPYAYHLAEQWFTVEWSDDRPENQIARWWRMSVRHFLGFDFVHVWRNRRVIRRADAVWTHTEREHLAVALLKTLSPRRYRAVSIAQSVWLWDLWPNVSRVRAAFFHRLVKRHAVEVVLSRVNRDASREAVPGRTVVRVPFGTHFASPNPGAAPAGTPRILVVGNDRHRDWDLLAAVTELVPEAHFDLISLSEDVHARQWPAHVHVRSATQPEVLAAYATSTVVALPLLPNCHASGCTVAIEAISAGIPIVVSDAGGIDEYVTGADADLVPVGDAAAFAAAIRRRLAGPAGAAAGSTAADRGLSERDYVARLALLTQAALSGAAFDPAVEAFQRVADAPRVRSGVTA
ncbi:glycosyltransferase [Microbacterium sp. zg.B48]|uniref:glycosyltransferase n=1 Tax=Microbacterium sp. zg.B48 TaxID=2969408 RepID=UPI00214CCE3A|nr:glycosyltransferase [Microbacterium sp. zg.B48]MCR2763300.1 glycosyltransferase [Microbacterium sp. zg.B48]